MTDMAIRAENVVDQPIGQQAFDAKGQIHAILLASFDFPAQFGKILKCKMRDKSRRWCNMKRRF